MKQIPSANGHQTQTIDSRGVKFTHIDKKIYSIVNIFKTYDESGI